MAWYMHSFMLTAFWRWYSIPFGQPACQHLTYAQRKELRKGEWVVLWSASRWKTTRQQAISHSLLIFWYFHSFPWKEHLLNIKPFKKNLLNRRNWPKEKQTQNKKPKNFKSQSTSQKPQKAHLKTNQQEQQKSKFSTLSLSFPSGKLNPPETVSYLLV